MNSKKIAIGLLLILAAVYLSGCIEPDDELAGTYICKTCDGVLDLYEKGEWELLEKGSGSYGNYTAIRDEVRLKLEGIGTFVPMKIDGHDLIDPDGDRWVRD